MVHFIIILLLRKGVKFFFGLYAYFFIYFLVINEKGLFCGFLAKMFQPMRRRLSFRFAPRAVKKRPTHPCVSFVHILACILSFMEHYALRFPWKKRLSGPGDSSAGAAPAGRPGPAPLNRQKATFYL